MEMRDRTRKSGHFMPVNYIDPKRAFCGSVQDVSESGIKIQITNPLKKDADTTMTFLEYEPLGSVKLKGHVVRSWSNGFALKFTEPDARSESVIRAYVAKE